MTQQRQLTMVEARGLPQERLSLSREEILADYPELEPEDIDACLKFARDRIDHPIVAA